VNDTVGILALGSLPAQTPDDQKGIMWGMTWSLYFTLGSLARQSPSASGVTQLVTLTVMGKLRVK
jgi:hypothetical protein